MAQPLPMLTWGQYVAHLAEIYITPSQAALLLHVNRLAVRRWVKTGKLRGELVGRVTLIWKEDVKRLAMEREQLFNKESRGYPPG